MNAIRKHRGHALWLGLGLIFSVGVLLPVGSSEPAHANSNCCQVKDYEFCSPNAPAATKVGEVTGSAYWTKWAVWSDVTAKVRGNSPKNAYYQRHIQVNGQIGKYIVTPCSGWAYKWAAQGALGGRIYANSSAAIGMTDAYGGISAGIDATGPFKSGKVMDNDACASSKSGGMSVGLSVKGPTGSWGSGGVSSQTGPTTKSLGDSDSEAGPGTEVQVNIEMNIDVKAVAKCGRNGVIGISKCRAWSKGQGGVILKVVLSLLCAPPGGSVSIDSTLWNPKRKGGGGGNKRRAGVVTPGDGHVEWGPVDDDPSIPSIPAPRPAPGTYPDPNDDGWFRKP